MSAGTTGRKLSLLHSAVTAALGTAVPTGNPLTARIAAEIQLQIALQPCLLVICVAYKWHSHGVKSYSATGSPAVEVLSPADISNLNCCTGELHVCIKRQKKGKKLTDKKIFLYHSLIQNLPETHLAMLCFVITVLLMPKHKIQEHKNLQEHNTETEHHSLITTVTSALYKTDRL